MQIVTEQSDRLLNVTEVAARLSLSVRSIWKMAAKGDLPQPLHLGGSRRWRQSAIQTFIEKLAESQK